MIRLHLEVLHLLVQVNTLWVWLVYHVIMFACRVQTGDSEGLNEQVTPSVAAPPPEVSNNTLHNEAIRNVPYSGFLTWGANFCFFRKPKQSCEN